MHHDCRVPLDLFLKLNSSTGFCLPHFVHVFFIIYTTIDEWMDGLATQISGADGFFHRVYRVRPASAHLLVSSLWCAFKHLPYMHTIVLCAYISGLGGTPLKMEPRVGHDPTTCSLQVSYSGQLSYQGIESEDWQCSDCLSPRYCYQRIERLSFQNNRVQLLITYGRTSVEEVRQWS